MATSRPVHAPYDGTVAGTVDYTDRDGMERALATAYALYRDRSKWLAPARRIEILRKTAALMEAQWEHLALEAAREGGKPLADSRVEVRRAIDGVISCVDLMRTEAGHVIPMDINAASANRVASRGTSPSASSPR
jgi:acyl-CoA reductase-like NAD-dependent aldehyde dehydrogenase